MKISILIAGLTMGAVVGFGQTVTNMNISKAEIEAGVVVSNLVCGSITSAGANCAYIRFVRSWEPLSVYSGSSVSAVVPVTIIIPPSISYTPGGGPAVVVNVIQLGDTRPVPFSTEWVGISTEGNGMNLSVFGPPPQLSWSGAAIRIGPATGAVPDNFSVELGAMQTLDQLSGWWLDERHGWGVWRGYYSSALKINVLSQPPDTPAPVGALSVNKAVQRKDARVLLTWEVH